MSFVADLHLHSPYAYATSSALTLENLAHWARLKGIDLLATADFTHPTWAEELKQTLTEDSSGTYSYGGVNFIMGTEVSCVYKQGGRGRRVHLLVFSPDMQTAARLSKAFSSYGNLKFDGRPTLSISVQELVHLVLETNPDCLIVPAHAWTPWYGIYGSKSGFNSLSEAFGDVFDYIPAIETGLSSDPEMNWSVPELGSKAIVSFSDAHSLPKLGREVTVFGGQPSYEGLKVALQRNLVDYTVEMYPEEGKYHYDGHRKCGVCSHPEESNSNGGRCLECNRPLTLGVLHRVLELAGEDFSTEMPNNPWSRATSPAGSISSSSGRPPFFRMVPLLDIIAAVRQHGPNTKGVLTEYQALVGELGSELQVLLWAKEAELVQAARIDLVDAVLKARKGEIHIEPGYDGVYGKVSVSSPIANGKAPTSK